MKAILMDGFGGPEKLRLGEAPDPQPEEDEVLIRVVCAGVNPVDWKIREGLLEKRLPHEFPIVPGWDAAGTVEGFGRAAYGVRFGRRVYAYCRKPVVRAGCWAEFVTMRADAVAPIPENLSFAQAAAVPLAALTAWQSLCDPRLVKAGDAALIHAGAGAVGGYAIQFAKHLGARVLTTASEANHAYVKSLGADVAIDYRRGGFAEAVRAAAPEGVDFVFDAVGGATQKESWRVLRRGGTLVGIVSPPDEAEAAAAGVAARYVFVSPNGEQLREIGDLLASGAVKPPAVEELPLERAAEAQERSKAGHVRGKLVLRVAEG